jgi:hypothetical protein
VLTTQNAGALVQGAGVSQPHSKDTDMVATTQAGTPASVKVRVTKAFYVAGAVKAKGEVVELPRAVAAEMIWRTRPSRWSRARRKQRRQHRSQGLTCDRCRQTIQLIVEWHRRRSAPGGAIRPRCRRAPRRNS